MIINEVEIRFFYRISTLSGCLNRHCHITNKSMGMFVFYNINNKQGKYLSMYDIFQFHMYFETITWCISGTAQIQSQLLKMKIQDSTLHNQYVQLSEHMIQKDLTNVEKVLEVKFQSKIY